MGAKHGIKNEGILIDCPTKMEPCAICKVVFSCVSDVGVKMVDGSSELHPPGCHSKDVCPYMRSNYQHYMAFIVHKIAGIEFISKQCNPVGGMSQDAEAMAVEAEAAPNAAPMPMAENAAAPAETRPETRRGQRLYICVQDPEETATEEIAAQTAAEGPRQQQQQRQQHKQQRKRQ